MGISALLTAAPPPVLATTTPSDVSMTAGAVGLSPYAARGDHVHLWTQPDTGWQTPTLQNGWLNYSTIDINWRDAVYRRIGNIVIIEGLMRSGPAGSTIFTLPAGYRPVRNLLWSTFCDAGVGRLDVTSSGQVNHQTGGTAYFSINCVFVAEL
jgi:hypothetical protein